MIQQMPFTFEIFHFELVLGLKEDGIHIAQVLSPLTTRRTPQLEQLPLSRLAVTRNCFLPSFEKVLRHIYADGLTAGLPTS